MRTPTCCLASCLLVPLAVLAVSSPAVAAPRISGELSKRGYTVIALAASDKARIVRATNRRFTIRPPARRVSLHLRAPDGTYAGPVVVTGQLKGRRAILGIRAGARLGRIAVRPRKGYARVSRRLSEGSIDERRWARASGGAPIGAGNFGFVRSQPRRHPPPGDRDADGIPDVLDVDNNGNRILDRLDRPRGVAAASQAEERFGFFTRLTLELTTTANANAGGLTQEQMEEQMDMAVSNSLDLLLTLLPSDPSPDSPELDCGGSIQQPPRPTGLIYCRPHSSGGTGKIGRYPPTSNEMPFPDCCDPNSNGLGTLIPDPGSPDPRGVMTLHTGATTAEIGTGDVMAQRVIRDGVKLDFLAAIDYVFASVPAIVSYDDGQGSSATIAYPVSGPAPGTRDNGFPVRAGPDGQVVVTLSFWRPQRRPIPPDDEGQGGDRCLQDTPPCEWIDIGGLQYEVQMEESGRRCPQTAFSTTDDDVELEPSRFGSPGFRDGFAGGPADPGNRLTYTLNLSECLTANGFTFNPGDDRAFSFLAVNPNGTTDNAQQTLWFRRVP